MSQEKLKKIVQTSSQMHQKMSHLHEHIENSTFHGEDQGVSLHLKGDGAMHTLQLSPESLAQGPEVLSQAIQAAHQQAFQGIKQGIADGIRQLAEEMPQDLKNHD